MHGFITTSPAAPLITEAVLAVYVLNGGTFKIKVGRVKLRVRRARRPPRR